jgi:hypothetical protein
MNAQSWLDKRLAPEQQRLLRRQGFVTAEALPSGRQIYKLRYRDAERRQRVLYIGADAQLAQAVADRVAELQVERRRRAELRRAMAAALVAQRRDRRLLAPVLAEHGFHFHGFTLRRTRGAHQLTPEGPRDPAAELT